MQCLVQNIYRSRMHGRNFQRHPQSALLQHTNRLIQSQVTKCDCLVIGGGIAGASVSYQLQKLHGLNVVVLEKENSPGYHATGKAFGIFAESNARTLETKLLTSLSRPFFQSPDEECVDDYIRENFPEGVLTQTGLLAVSSPPHYPFLYEHFGPTEGMKFKENIHVLPQADICNYAPFLQHEELAKCAIWEPQAANFNTGLVYEHFLIGGNHVGVRYFFNQSALEVTKANSGNWEVLTYNAETNSIDRFEAGMIVNSCGQWADETAKKAGITPIDLVTHKRNVIVFTYSDKRAVKAKKASSKPYRLPFQHEQVEEEEEEKVTPWLGWVSEENAQIFHSQFQGNNGIFLYDRLVEKLDEDDEHHHADVDEMEICIHKINSYTHLKVDKVASKTAGIKCSVQQDRNMVVGPSVDDASFIWLAALSGHGIQCSPAYSELCSYLAVNKELPAKFTDIGMDVRRLLPSRLQNAGSEQKAMY
eukprot:CAMPEP_0197044302 /NCGR_PEP_ID=MMETSP1384-20130603/20386_1 /TAXON_ID=29189 /ORGANISM="Ammonia sp." /LENGTH=475 /DNA_ID=CAMNT_0042475735 /DNA_START=14 /DNA_END=1441 /DNA_ORIENTATION=-